MEDVTIIYGDSHITNITFKSISNPSVIAIPKYAFQLVGETEEFIVLQTKVNQTFPNPNA